MNLTVDATFLNIEQLNIVLKKNAEAHNKILADNSIYLENSEFEYYRVTYIKEKTKAIAILTSIESSHSDMLDFIFEKKRSVINRRDKTKNTYRNNICLD